LFAPLGIGSFPTEVYKDLSKKLQALEAHGSRYLVLELVEGETLAERIARGPIPVEEALDIAKNICEALEAAHEKGIIHRDRKPANIKITLDGKVKVLDFGLAKAMAGSAPATTLSNSPTLLNGTMGGAIIGTAAYMSPEQARGREADRRTDIFAFGCVLYEMLSGRPAFDGEDVLEILSRILQREPDPFFSPDGQWIGFFLFGASKKVLQLRGSDGKGES